MKLYQMHDCQEKPECLLPKIHEGHCAFEVPVTIDYTNWKGVRRLRKVAPTCELMYSTNKPWHPTEQWFFGAIDVEDGKHKFFAMAGLHNWKSE